MQTECSVNAYEFPASCGRRVVAHFDGGRMSSDDGVILLGVWSRGLMGWIDDESFWL